MPTESTMPVAMSLTAGTLSGHTHTLRSITSPWEISVMFNPQPSTSGAAVCMPTTLAPAQYTCTGGPELVEAIQLCDSNLTYSAGTGHFSRLPRVGSFPFPLTLTPYCP